MLRKVEVCYRGAKQLPCTANFRAVENRRLHRFQRLLRQRETEWWDLGREERNWITARYSTTVQFECGAAIFKEDL